MGNCTYLVTVRLYDEVEGYSQCYYESDEEHKEDAIRKAREAYRAERGVPICASKISA